MLIHIQDDILRLWGMGLLEPLLADRTTEQNILWATDAYEDEYGHRFARDETITADKITGDYAGLICTRARKAFEQQSQRTRQRAEVFTPLWIVEKMNDYLDEEWFQRKDGIHKQDEDGRIAFNTRKTWQQYVENRRLEITCGEAPFLVTRYDAVSGEILPIEKRIGLLDRKLRAVSENTKSVEDWFAWALRALRATYGYEFQGDSLLIARLNVIMSVWEAMETRWGQTPTASQLRKAVEIVTWNLWQMDGLTNRTPYAIEDQMSIFDLLPDAKPPVPSFCRIKNWRKQRANQFRSLKGERTSMKFDYIIGNPPYQDEVETSENKTFMPSIYNLFIEEAYSISDKVELIHPARFLFNAGQTPKAWNQKMLSDPHFKILFYEPDGSKVFSGPEIKGGIAISYRDSNAMFGAIKVFTKHAELNSILSKISGIIEESSITIIMQNQNRFNLEAMFDDHPEYREKIGSDGKDRRFRNNIFEKIPLFTTEKVNSDDIQVLGVIKNKRVWRYISRKYVDEAHQNLGKWKVLIGAASGSGVFGETISAPIILAPGQGYTQTYIGIGGFDAEVPAKNLEKYIKTKFFRAMLGILKITQHNEIGTFKYVPLQDFSPSSDINWSQPVADIDRQLYAKYGLDEKEIEFIETHVKEMA